MPAEIGSDERPKPLRGSPDVVMFTLKTTIAAIEASTQSVQIGMRFHNEAITNGATDAWLALDFGTQNHLSRHVTAAQLGHHERSGSTDLRCGCPATARPVSPTRNVLRWFEPCRPFPAL